MSYASITPTPTAIPARDHPDPRPFGLRFRQEAHRRVHGPEANDLGRDPQQEVEKKSEFSAAASAPRMQAHGESRSRRKQKHAPMPARNIAVGHKIFS